MPFAAAQVLVEVPYLLAQAVLFSCISYWMVHFEADPGDCPSLPSPSYLHLLLANGGGGDLHVCTFSKPQDMYRGSVYIAADLGCALIYARLGGLIMRDLYLSAM